MAFRENPHHTSILWASSRSLSLSNTIISYLPSMVPARRRAGCTRSPPRPQDGLLSHDAGALDLITAPGRSMTVPVLPAVLSDSRDVNLVSEEELAEVWRAAGYVVRRNLHPDAA